MLTQHIATRPRLVIRFQTLGTPDLTGADGHTVGSVLAGPKRVALLAYLALEGANGLVRRDSLLPLFWPESDTDRARASLRSALLTLRRSLGEGVVVTRGDDEVGIGDSRLWCDAVEFRRLRAAVEQHLAAMQAFAPNPLNANRVPRHLLRPAAVRARLAAQLGDTAAALRLLEERHKSTSESAFASVNYFQRHLRPVLLRAVGRDEEALRWYGAAPWTGSSNTEDAFWDVVHLAPFHFARTEMLERERRPREAAEHYREVTRLWWDADPELRPWVATAEQRLAQLARAR